MRAAVRRVVPWLVGAVALTVYLRTLYPGLVPMGDSPKFQFVGQIWGTPHNPGYPLYVVVSHLFSRLPIGTPAYRINVMSAVFGALAVALLATAIRRLTGSVAAAAGGALVLAFGRVFWSQAIVAEVYTLGAALLAAALCFLLRWEDTRRPRDLWLAVAAVALALGNHLTIVMVAPAFLLFVLAVDWRAALRPRVLLVATVILLAGISQYGLIVYWTSRHPPYLESSARTFSELLDVMRGAQFSGRLFTDTAQIPARERHAALFGLLLQELRPWGVALAAVGVGVLVARRRWPAVILLTVASGIVWFFVLNYYIADPQVFLIPVFVMAAMAAGVALGWVHDLVRARDRWTRGGAAVVIALTPAVVLASANYRSSDHHRRTYEIRLFDAVFRHLPDTSVVVPGTFAEHLMLAYKIHGERGAGAAGIRQVEKDASVVRRAWESGDRVFAFRDARDELSRAGLVFEPVVLWDQTLPELLRDEPAGRIVAVAGLGLGALVPSGRPAALPEIGGTLVLAGRVRADYAAIGVTGRASGAIEDAGNGAAVRAERGRVLTGLPGGLPIGIEASSESGGRISIDGREAVVAPYAVAFAVLDSEGRLLRTGVADPSQGLRVRFDGDPQLFQLVDVRECRDVGNLGWQDVSALASRGQLAGRIDNYRPFAARVRLVVVGDMPLNPRLLRWQGPGTPVFAVAPAVAANLSRVAFTRTLPPNADAYLVEFTVDDDGQWGTFGMDFGGPVREAFISALVDLNNPRRATVCAGGSM